MNSLTLVIYLSGLVGKLSTVLAGLIPLLVVGGIFMSIAIAASYIEGCPYGDKHSFKKLNYLLIPLILSGIIYVVVPSRETILLMAGSEFSEQVVNTPEAKELLEGVRQVIKSQLEQYTKKEQ